MSSAIIQGYTIAKELATILPQDLTKEQKGQLTLLANGLSQITALNDQVKTLQDQLNEARESGSADTTSKGWRIAKPILITAAILGLIVGALAAVYFTGADKWLAANGVFNSQVTMIAMLVGAAVALAAISVLIVKLVCACRAANQVQNNEIENEGSIPLLGLDDSL